MGRIPLKSGDRQSPHTIAGFSGKYWGFGWKNSATAWLMRLHSQVGGKGTPFGFFTTQFHVLIGTDRNLAVDDQREFMDLGRSCACGSNCEQFDIDFVCIIICSVLSCYKSVHAQDL
jgi:hypothetical protein